MSLLADLLAKKNTSTTTMGKDIPPTLAEAHLEPAPSAPLRSQRSRYLVLSMISVAVITAGGIAISQLDRLNQLLAPTPQTVPPPRPAPAAAPPSPPVVPPVETAQKIEPEPVVAAKEEAASPVAPAKQKNHKRTPPHVRRTHPRYAAPHRLTAQPVVATLEKPAPPAVAMPSASSGTGRSDLAKRDTYLYAAQAAEQAGDWRTALANYRKAQKYDPDNHIIMNNSAAALNNLAQFDDGAREARRALEKKPDYVPAMVNAAIAYSSKGNTQEALQLFSDAALADPGNRSLIINLGIMQERTGNLDQALATYRPLVEDNDPLALHGTARIQERKGNRQEAIRLYRRIMALPLTPPGVKKEVKGSLSRLED